MYIIVYIHEPYDPDISTILFTNCEIYHGRKLPSRHRHLPGRESSAKSSVTVRCATGMPSRDRSVPRPSRRAVPRRAPDRALTWCSDDASEEDDDYHHQIYMMIICHMYDATINCILLSLLMMIKKNYYYYGQTPSFARTGKDHHRRNEMIMNKQDNPPNSPNYKW